MWKGEKLQAVSEKEEEEVIWEELSLHWEKKIKSLSLIFLLLFTTKRDTFFRGAHFHCRHNWCPWGGKREDEIKGTFLFVAALLLLALMNFSLASYSGDNLNFFFFLSRLGPCAKNLPRGRTLSYHTFTLFFLASSFFSGPSIFGWERRERVTLAHLNKRALPHFFSLVCASSSSLPSFCQHSLDLTWQLHRVGEGERV